MDGEKRGSGESQETETEETVTTTISLPPPSRGVTPVVMWINAHAHGAAACSGGARARGTPLSFSQLLNLDE